MKNKNHSRVYGNKVEIDESAVQNFFSSRSGVVSQDNPYVSVLYQDSDPDLAIQRDKLEKEKILPLLRLSESCALIDIGCGIGRWADQILPIVGHYLGLDPSESLIEKAKRRHPTKATFKVVAAEKLSPNHLVDGVSYNRAIIAGVFLYMNDSAVAKTAEKMGTLLASDSLIYVREPLALDQRLTLKGFWSEEMQSNYSAIYRTREEIDILLSEQLSLQGFRADEWIPLYEEGSLNNRKETRQFYRIFNRGS